MNEARKRKVSPVVISIVLLSLAVALPISSLRRAAGVAPVWPGTALTSPGICPTTGTTCPDCAAPLIYGNNGCTNGPYPAAGWYITQCAQQSGGTNRCSDTTFDCGRLLDCATGLVKPSMCSNTNFCK